MNSGLLLDVASLVGDYSGHRDLAKHRAGGRILHLDEFSPTGSRLMGHPTKPPALPGLSAAEP